MKVNKREKKLWYFIATLIYYVLYRWCGGSGEQVSFCCILSQCFSFALVQTSKTTNTSYKLFKKFFFCFISLENRQKFYFSILFMSSIFFLNFLILRVFTAAFFHAHIFHGFQGVETLCVFRLTLYWFLWFVASVQNLKTHLMLLWSICDFFLLFFFFFFFFRSFA